MVKKIEQLHADTLAWAEENRKLRESIARGDTVIIHDQRELSLVIER